MRRGGANLTERLDRFIAAEVGSGRSGNASEVVREGLRLMERRKQEDRARLKWLRGAVREGLEEIGRGEGTESASVEELERQIDRLAAESPSFPAGARRRD